MGARTGRAVAGLLVVALLAGLAAAVVFLAVRFLPAGELFDPRPSGPPEACSEPDPSGTGCLTPTMLRVHDLTLERFGAPGPGAPVRAVTCSAERPWNPGSDHPAGRACDFFPTRAGTFPEGAERDAGWAVAQWLRDEARDLDVRYVIWQGRIWYRGTGDSADGWGRPYTGGGVYDPGDATGGHFDHVHVSVGPRGAGSRGVGS